jgi:hypothetical protein
MARAVTSGLDLVDDYVEVFAAAFLLHGTADEVAAGSD